MSKQELQQHSYCEKAISLKNDLETGFIVLAEHLYNINQNNLWEASYGSWLEFTWELKMSPNHINTLMRIYRTLIVGYGLTSENIKTAGGWSVIAEILPYCTSKKDAVKWILKAQQLTRADLRKELKEEKTGILMGVCPHDVLKEIVMCECTNCKFMFRKL